MLSASLNNTFPSFLHAYKHYHVALCVGGGGGGFSPSVMNYIGGGVWFSVMERYKGVGAFLIKKKEKVLRNI